MYPVMCAGRETNKETKRGKWLEMQTRKELAFARINESISIRKPKMFIKKKSVLNLLLEHTLYVNHYKSVNLS